MKKHIFTVFLPLLLTGCLGSMVLEDEDVEGDFPSLHSVPPRPVHEDPQATHELKDQAELSRQDMVEFNRRWREQHGMFSVKD